MSNLMLPFLLLLNLLPGFTAMAGEPEPLKNGARLNIADADARSPLFVEVLTQASQKISAKNLQLDDIPAFLFGLNGKNKIEADEWTLFYNNLKSPGNSVEIVTRELDPQSKIYKTVFRIDLGKVPANINELSFALATSLEGDVEDPLIKDLEFITAVLRAGENKIAVFSPQPGSLTEERAIFLLTFYRHGESWKIRAQGDGFKGGFASLFRSFGGERSDNPDIKGQEPPPKPAVPDAPAQQTQSLSPAKAVEKPASITEQRDRITLEKIERRAPSLVSLAKKVNALVDKLGLGEIVADVLVALDGSGSMYKQYPDGIQKLINRVVPLALRLDPDGAIPCYAFATNCARLSIDTTTGEEVGDNITLENYADFIKRAQQSRMPYEQTTQGGFLRFGGTSTDKIDASGNKIRKPYSSGGEIFYGLGHSNEEVALLEMLNRDYAGTRKPVLAIIVHDGGVGSASAISKKIISLANEGVPIYFQIVGWAGSNYGVLKRLDTLEGRRIDNTGFFELTHKDLIEMPEDVLLQNILKEFPAWLKAAREQGIIDEPSCRPRLI